MTSKCLYLKVFPIWNLAEFRWFDKKPLGIVRIIKRWSKTGKNSVALLKPRSLVLALLWCLIQMGITVLLLLSLIIRNVLTLSATLFQSVLNFHWLFPLRSYSDKHEKWLLKMKVRPKKRKILCVLDKLNVQNNLNKIN